MQGLEKTSATRAVETAVDDLHQAAGTVRNHELGFRFRSYYPMHDPDMDLKAAETTQSPAASTT
jgi:hypothetical protein